MKLIVIIVISLLVSACSFSGKRAPDKLYYRFPEFMHAPVGKNVIVKRPSAMGIIGNRPMVAQNVDGSLLQMQHNFWLESPKILLQNYLEKIFVNNGANDNTLNAQILHLEKKQQLAIVEIKFIITNSERQQIFNKTYIEESKLAENTIASFVKSTSILLKKIVNQLIDDMP
ncbi:MAG: hypothetical protein JKY19_05845 [Alcanivoracaceae bacterium]|nr:hypothetical protein [Alcanivoracaceae bacterium]